jgi:hypothetical protein
VRQPLPLARNNDWADLAALLQVACWLSAWLLLPAWLGLRGAPASAFLSYACGAGLLTACGAIGANSASFLSHPRFAALFAAAVLIAVLLLGGIVFLLAGALRG